jgi:hypothetical protein
MFSKTLTIDSAITTTSITIAIQFQTFMRCSNINGYGALDLVSVMVGGRLGADHTVACIEQKILVTDSELRETRNGIVSSAKLDINE